MATIVNDANFDQEVIQSEIPVLVDFFAEWCGPCRTVAPLIDELATEYEGKCKVVKLDIDESSELASKYGVMSIPTMVMFKGGESAETVVGARSKDDLKAMIDKHV